MSKHTRTYAHTRVLRKGELPLGRGSTDGGVTLVSKKPQTSGLTELGVK